VGVVDPGRPLPDRRDGIAAGEEQVPGVHAQANVGDLEDPLDLPRRLDRGARLVVERGFVAAIAAAPDDDRETLTESSPARIVQAETAVVRCPPGTLPTRVTAGIRERRPGRRGVPVRSGLVERVEQLVERRHGALQRLRIGVRQLDVGADEPEAAAGQALTQLRATAEEPDRAEIDPGIARGRDLVQHVEGRRDVRVDPDGHLEGAVADRRVGEGDPGRCHRATVGWSTGRPVRAHSMIAWQNAMSRTASRPGVAMGVPSTMALWNATSSRLKLLS
jgi:hypothetical protein